MPLNLKDALKKQVSYTSSVCRIIFSRTTVVLYDCGIWILQSLHFAINNSRYLFGAPFFFFRFSQTNWPAFDSQGFCFWFWSQICLLPLRWVWSLVRGHRYRHVDYSNDTLIDENSPKFVRCKSVLVVLNGIFPYIVLKLSWMNHRAMSFSWSHSCGEEHLGSASKTEGGTHRCSVKSVTLWIQFMRKWSKPEVKTGDFLNTSGSF